MKTSRFHIALLSAVLAAAAALPAPAQEVTIAPWKGGAAGAYTVTMDDFCADHIKGIQNHADTMFHNRGLPMAFGALMGECDEADWKIAERMIGHGHELMNHSWTHACGRAGLDWCQPYWGPDKYSLEIDKSTQVAEDRLKIKVRFFIFPYDEWEPHKLEYLKQKGYLGARTGIKGAVTPGDFKDGFNLNFDVNWPRSDARRWEFQKFTLDGYIDAALAKGGWAIRETHGVNDSSWGYLLPDELRSHLDYAKQKKDLGLLWVAGPTEILKYRKQRDSYQVVGVREPQRVVVQFLGSLDTTIYDAALTLTVTVPADLPSGWQVYQQGRPIAFQRMEGGRIRLDAYPHRGPVVVTTNPFLALRDGAAARRPGLAFAAHAHRVHFHLASAGAYRLELLSAEGRVARTVSRGVRTPGAHSVDLDRTGLGPGVYLLRLEQDGVSRTVRVPLIR